MVDCQPAFAESQAAHCLLPTNFAAATCQTGSRCAPHPFPTYKTQQNWSLRNVCPHSGTCTQSKSKSKKHPIAIAIVHAFKKRHLRKGDVDKGAPVEQQRHLAGVQRASSHLPHMYPALAGIHSHHYYQCVLEQMLQQNMLPGKLTCKEEGVGKCAPVGRQPFALQVLDCWEDDSLTSPHQAGTCQHHIHRLAACCHRHEDGEYRTAQHPQAQYQLGCVSGSKVSPADIGHCVAHKEHTAATCADVGLCCV